MTLPTQWLRVARADADDAAIREAAHLLREGGIVAFPTETVYGLGAIASNGAAVRKVFAAKGRPASVPLIIHVRDVEQARKYVKAVPNTALALAKAHWPGPLTLVLDRADGVPDDVSAGGPTVGVRVPNHPVALALLDVLGEGIAAPSANLYDRLPPVRAEHVMDGLAGRIDAVLDAGRCPGGLESTVLDARSEPVLVLRRGMVATDRLGVPAVDMATEARPREGGWIRVGEAADYPAWASEHVGQALGHVAMSDAASGRVMPLDAQSYAQEMYDVLHELWACGCVKVWVDAPPRGGCWDSIWDRLVRLSGVSRS